MLARKIRFGWIAISAIAWLLGNAAPALAGCGCDHPPPAWAPVMPAFAAPGGKVRVWAKDAKFEVGKAYQVRFGALDLLSAATFTAVKADYLDVKVPAGELVGPVAIRVWRTTGGLLPKTVFDLQYGNDLFTVLPAYARIPNQAGVYDSLLSSAAVAADGTVLVPIDLTDVLDATQFAFEFDRLALAYGASDVVFYNKDGVDLTLFTLAVADPTQREWGSYYGWDVEDDTSLGGTYFEPKVLRSLDLLELVNGKSDMLTYWRHEFHTYRTAHMLGGTHYVDENGFHKDGTFHIDHDHVVLAIHGVVRSLLTPNDLGQAHAVAPGSVLVGLRLAVQPSEHPIEPAWMASRIGRTTNLQLSY